MLPGDAEKIEWEKGRSAMDLAWGDAPEGSTAGLDIAGVRSLDQQMEALLVNGITTVSLRGRYFTILPWTIAEFFSSEVGAGETSYSQDRFATFLRRIEFLVLTCTSVDNEGAAAGGALGTLTFDNQVKALAAGEAVPFPVDGGGAMLGTYFGPCRALGLLATPASGSAVPVIVTPRGKTAWETRNGALDGTNWRSIVSAERIKPEEARALAPHFSLRSLKFAAAEAATLRLALLEPWRPADGTEARVVAAYDRFAQTVDWLQAGSSSELLRADDLLAAAWRRVAAGTEGSPIDLAWAEYEWRCRLHFAVELMLSAVSSAVEDRGNATLEELVGEWLAEPGVPARLSVIWPRAGDAGGMSGAEARSSIPADLWLNGGLPSDLDRLPPYARALVAFALVSSLATQSASLRAAGRFADHRAVGERAILCVDAAGETPFADTVRSLVGVAVEAHLSTTFRKMSGRQKCSLRFFPEGPKLFSTRASTRPGRSGTRLWNVIRVLKDAGMPGLGSGA